MSGLAERCAASLAESAAFRSKCDIGRVASRIESAPRATLAFREQPDRILLGDDTAAIPDGHGYLLLAAEGMLPNFLERDPIPVRRRRKVDSSRQRHIGSDRLTQGDRMTDGPKCLSRG